MLPANISRFLQEGVVEVAEEVVASISENVLCMLPPRIEVPLILFNKRVFLLRLVWIVLFDVVGEDELPVFSFKVSEMV